MPLNPILFRLLRLELRALWVNGLNAMHPRYLARRRALAGSRDSLVNIGCGPFGHQGWINFDLLWSGALGAVALLLILSSA